MSEQPDGERDDVAFDEADARAVEELYTTDTAKRRREFVRDHLAPEAGEEILSIGPGPGFEPAALAEAVGPTGHVHAVDESEPMLDLARRRCGDAENVTLERGRAADLPVDADTFDAAVSVQVFEYVADVGAALAELRRVLRPGGRGAVYATDWDSLVWHADDRDRMARVLRAWGSHRTHPHLGSRLRGPLRAAGLDLVDVVPFTILETELEDTFAGHLRGLVRSHVAAHEDDALVEAWADDLREREAADETLFALTAFLYLVRAPARQ